MKKAIYTNSRFKIKKIIILFLLLTTALISCTQNGNDNTAVNTEVLILGKWNLISDKYGKTFLQHGKNVPQKNYRVRYAMNEAVTRYLKNNPKQI